LNLGAASWLVTSLNIDNKAQRLQAAVWVLRAAPAGAAGTAQVLLSVPNMPLDAAKQLVSAGSRVSYAQLLAAAHSMVAGVEVWVQAQRELGVPSDIPAAAEAICCSDVCKMYIDWVSAVLLRHAAVTAAACKTVNMCLEVYSGAAMQSMVHGFHSQVQTLCR
jgi:hypothetical protein